jgi:hypothetical protein
LHIENDLYIDKRYTYVEVSSPTWQPLTGVVSAVTVISPNKAHCGDVKIKFGLEE